MIFLLLSRRSRRVTDTSNEYNYYSKLWRMNRDFIDGSFFVKNSDRCREYLPKPEGMSDDDYKGYLYRAEFCPFAGRTVEGCHGMMFSKPMMLTYPERLKNLLENVDGKGNDFDKFINDVTFDTMKVGFSGVLLDAPKTQSLSQKEAEQEGNTPYMVFYRAEDIINIQKKNTGRKEEVTLIVLKEKVCEPSPKDKFIVEEKNRYRVCELDEDGLYCQSLYDDAGVLITDSVVYPEWKGKKFNFIPFYFFPQTVPTVPMFAPVVDVNASWYHKSADLENGLHWCGVPTPLIFGTPPTHSDGKGNEVAEDVFLGGSKVLFIPNGSDAKYFELSGSGLSNIVGAMAHDEERMAILGARVISQEKKGVESAETARIHRAGENSVIATFALEMSKVANRLLRDYLEWCENKDIEEDIKVKINTDYDISKMSSSEVVAMVEAWQKGIISKRTAFENLKEGEIIKDRTFEEEEELIAQDKEQAMADAVAQAQIVNAMQSE